MANINYSNKFYINGNDCWDRWSVLFEKGVFNQLKKKAKRKPQYERVLKGKSGTMRYVANSLFESRVLQLPGVFICSNKAEYLEKSVDFEKYLKDLGYFTFDSVGLKKRYRFLYDDNPDVTFETAIDDNPNDDVVVRFTLQVIDDFPAEDWTVNDSTGVNTQVYGVERDFTAATPTLTRIGDSMPLHASLPIQSKMRRCVLKDDGTVNYYLDAYDSTKKANGGDAILDGTDGQVMVEIPTCYMRFVTDGNKERIYASDIPFAGGKEFKKRYISAYQSTVQRSTNKMASVVNLDDDFRGGNNTSLMNGMPRTAMSRAKGRVSARNRGSVNWNVEDYTTNLIVYWLYVIEYASFNSQLAFNANNTAQGYKQGGLGDGVTTADSTEWSNYNGSYPFVPMGHTNSLGNNTGVKNLVVPNFGGAGVDRTFSVPSYRGIENPFGHIFSILDGIQCWYDENENKQEFFVTENPHDFTDDSHSRFRKAGEIGGGNGYITRLAMGENGDTVPIENAGGSATTYMCDYLYLPSSISEYKWYAKGGSAPNGAQAGLACVAAPYRVSYSTANYGFRLCFIPDM